MNKREPNAYVSQSLANDISYMIKVMLIFKNRFHEDQTAVAMINEIINSIERSDEDGVFIQRNQIHKRDHNEA